MDANRWYFSKESVDNTPSRRDGVEVAKEVFYRQQAATLIQDMGQKLLVSQLCINSAIVYMHRFYMFHSFTKFHRNFMAPCCLFLACKVEEQPRKLEQLLRVGWSFINREAPPLDVKSNHFRLLYDELVRNENILLATLGFDCSIDHPHTHVVRCCQLIKASRDLAQTSYFMATNSLHLTTMCLQYRSTLVACVCIYLVYKWSGHEIPRSSEGREWFWYVDRDVTMEQLERVSEEFLLIFNQCPSKLKKKIMSSSKAISDQEAERRHRSEGQRTRPVPATSVSSTSSSSSAAVVDPHPGHQVSRHSAVHPAAASAAVVTTSTASSSAAARASRDRKEHTPHSRERRAPGQEHREMRLTGHENREVRLPGHDNREVRPSGQEHREARFPGQDHRDVRQPGQEVRDARSLAHEHRDGRPSVHEHREARSSGHDQRDATRSSGHERREVRPARDHRDPKPGQDHRDVRAMSGQDHREMRASEYRDSRSSGQDASLARVSAGSDSMPSFSRGSLSLSTPSSSSVASSTPSTTATAGAGRSSTALTGRGRSVGDVRQMLQGVDCRHSLLTTPTDKSRRSQHSSAATAVAPGPKSGSSVPVPRPASSDPALSGSSRPSVNGPPLLSPTSRRDSQSIRSLSNQPMASTQQVPVCGPSPANPALLTSSSLLHQSHPQSVSRAQERSSSAVNRTVQSQSAAPTSSRGPDQASIPPRLVSPPKLEPFTMSPPLILPGICDNVVSDDLAASSHSQLPPLLGIADPSAATMRGRSSIFSPPAVVGPAVAPLAQTVLSSAPTRTTGESSSLSNVALVPETGVKVEPVGGATVTKASESPPEPAPVPVAHAPPSLSLQPPVLTPLVSDVEDKHKHREKKKKHKEHKEHKAKKEKKKHKEKEHKQSKHRSSGENLSKLRITISRDRLGTSGVAPVEVDERRHDPDAASAGLKIRIGKDKLLPLATASESPVKKRGRDSDAAVDGSSAEHHRHHHSKHKSKHKRRRQDSEMSDSLQF